MISDTVTYVNDLVEKINNLQAAKEQQPFENCIAISDEQLTLFRQLYSKIGQLLCKY
jgi:hypothetical protein